MNLTAVYNDLHIEYEEKQSSPYQYARIKHLPRTVPEDYAPDEIIIQDKPAGTGIGTSFLYDDWWDHTKDTNSPQAWEWFTNFESMTFNNGVGGKIDISKHVNARLNDVGGNLMAFDKEENGYLRQVCYMWNMDTSKLDPLENNFFMTPEYYFYPCAISAYGKVRKIGGGKLGGLDIYHPRIARTERWIRKSQVHLLPSRPKTWMIKEVLMTDAEWLAFSE